MFRWCCICISLKTGSLISGIISLVSSIAVLIHVPKADEISHLGNISDDIQFFKRQCIYSFSVLSVLVSTLLIIGVIKVKKNKVKLLLSSQENSETARMSSKLILSFLWLGFMQCVVFLPVCITFITIESTSSGSSEDVYWTGFGFVMIPIIQSYFLLIIYHYHQELLNQADRRAGYEPIEELRI